MCKQSRRGFLTRTLGPVWTSAALLDQAFFRAAYARAGSATAPTNLFVIEKVADGVYAALARPQVLINCNAAIFENSRDILIVDTHSKPSASAALVAQIRKEITSKPIRYIVNTHFHLDHTQGAMTYKHVAPHADVVSCTTTRKLLAEAGASRARESVEAARKNLDDYQSKLAVSKSAADRAYYLDATRQATGYIREMQEYQPDLPNITFDRDLVIHDSAHELRLTFFGRGHTAGDIVLFCPEKKIVATGDLLHGFLPTILDGYPREWPVTLRKVGELPFEHVVPGHGAVQHTHLRQQQMASYLDELNETVARAKEAGRGVEQLQNEITPATLASLTRDDYGRFVGETLLKYSSNPPGTSAADVVAAGVHDNIGHIFQRLDVR